MRFSVLAEFFGGFVALDDFLSSVLRFLIYANVPLLNSVFFADAELNSSSFVLDLFPLTQYFHFEVYQTSNRMTDGFFEIVSKQLILQRQTYDLTAEVKSLGPVVQSAIKLILY